MDNHIECIQTYINKCDKINIVVYNSNIAKEKSSINTVKSYINESKSALMLSSKDPIYKLICEKILDSHKNISFTFDCKTIGCLFHHEKYNTEYINILFHAQTIRTFYDNENPDGDEKYLENIILKNNNIRKLTINSQIKINNSICDALQNKSLRYIGICDDGTIDWNNIYKIIKIKSLDKILINFCHKLKNNYTEFIKIVNVIIKNLDKNIEIILSTGTMGKLLDDIPWSRIILCNFKIKVREKHKFIFNEILKYIYIPFKLKTFNNLYDFNLNYIM